MSEALFTGGPAPVELILHTLIERYRCLPSQLDAEPLDPVLDDLEVLAARRQLQERFR